ncbi:unnamed protein product [Closterium sp. NIES-65]|nr:unnamed protein product [Closterium sp. NIES-65]
MGRKLPRNGSKELTDSLLLTAWLATVAPATSDRPSILSDSSLLSPLATVNYFAFGSNLNLDLLQRRSTGVNAPVAHVLGSAVAEEDPVVAEPAVVYHHRLAFNIRVLPPFEPAVAAIEPVAGIRSAVAGNRRDKAAGIRPALAGRESAVAQSREAVAEAGSAVARNGAAVAGMEGSDGSPSVHGLVVQMRRIDYERLMWSEGISRDEQRPYIEHLVTAHTYSGSTVQVLLFPPPHRRSFSSKFPFSILFLLQPSTLRANPNSPSFLPSCKELPPSLRRFSSLPPIRPSYPSPLSTTGPNPPSQSQQPLVPPLSQGAALLRILKSDSKEHPFPPSPLSQTHPPLSPRPRYPRP